ncbi:hypothetical protein ACFW6E_08875 [Streptomyces olivaceoviridis]|uniref:hypothetical protein n=1 Tax=Streptomyces olivaceoviridis TaxID=1921 RepID=UPI00369386AE
MQGTQPQPQPPTPAPWPNGVIARYLTVAGAHVDLTHKLTLPPESEPFATLATCTGCPATKEVGHWTASHSYADGVKEERDEERADSLARDWAQRHAETCRAMPRPEVS